jgi:DNA-binding Lrp family transcriptional regulator
VSNLSSKDAAIVWQIQKNARISNKALAAACHMAESTCLERVRNLEERGIIKGWHADIDLPALNRNVRALISVRLQPKTTEAVMAFEAAVLGAPETMNVWIVSGAYDFLVEVCVPSVDALRTFVFSVITSRPEVSDSQSSLVYEHHGRRALEALSSRE